MQKSRKSQKQCVNKAVFFWTFYPTKTLYI